MHLGLRELTTATALQNIFCFAARDWTGLLLDPTTAPKLYTKHFLQQALEWIQG